MSIWNRPNGWHNPFRLYRDPANGRISGVCAGIADFFGIRPFVIRLAAIFSLFFFFLPTFIGYVILSFALPKRPPALYASREEEVFWRGLATAPDDTLKSLRHKFVELEERLAGMERSVTSTDFDLHRKFRDIGG